MELHRFDLLCGGRKVHWRSVAEQLLNPSTVPARPARRDALLHVPLEAWELRILRAETEFAPVDEFGGRILSVPDGVTPVSFRSEASPPQPLGLNSPQEKLPPTNTEPETIDGGGTKTAPAVLPADNVEAKPANAATLPKFDELKREVKSTVDADRADVPVRDTRLADKFPALQWDRERADQFLIVLVLAVLSVFLFLFIVRGPVIVWRSVSRLLSLYRRLTSQTKNIETEADWEAAEAEACRELMKQVSTDLTRALSAINSLQRAPALQTALHKELDSIRRLLGFAPQTQGAPGEKRDWKQIKSQLVSGLQGTQRIIGIAEAVHTSFSFHPAAVEVITTRLEAYAFLGVNAGSSETVLKKTVNALRQCWHPDLARDEEDRRLREIRIRQINVAWDIISGKQMSA
jgi:hypothetical protein